MKTIELIQREDIEYNYRWGYFQFKGKLQYTVRNPIELSRIMLWAVQNNVAEDCSFVYGEDTYTCNEDGFLSEWPYENIEMNIMFEHHKIIFNRKQ